MVVELDNSQQMHGHIRSSISLVRRRVSVVAVCFLTKLDRIDAG